MSGPQADEVASWNLVAVTNIAMTSDVVRDEGNIANAELVEYVRKNRSPAHWPKEADKNDEGRCLDDERRRDKH